MSQSGNFTLFKSDSVSGSGAIDYVKDVFPDVTLVATDNTGLTNNSLTNPLGGFFANNDGTLFGAKRLLIKDIVLIQDTTKWVGNEPTYQIIWDQNFPAVSGYAFGAVRFNAKSGQNELNFVSAGNGIGVTGKVRRVALLVENSSGAGSANVFVDGVNTTSINFGNDAQFSSSLQMTLGIAPTSKYSAFVQGAANLTNDLHDVRFVSVQVTTLRVVGVIVYFENATANIEVNRGTTYVDKTKAISPAGSTLPIPTFGSSLGGVFITQKSTAAAISTFARSASTFGSLATGASGSNLVSVTTGDGVNFASGNGIVIGSGVSNYVGSVLSVSTDTLTVTPAPQIALAGTPIYTAWKSSPTLAIGASFYQLVDRVVLSHYFGGITTSILNTQNNYCIFGNNFGVTQGVVGNQTYGANYGRFLGASGFLQIDGYFSAVEAEWFSPGAIMTHNVLPNGTVGYSVSLGFSGIVKQTLIGDAGPGWNSVVVTPGASIGVTIGIMAINIYRRLQNNGATLGALASIDTLQSFTDRTAVNASLMALGTFKRVYGDEIYFQGAWDRQYSATSPNYIRYVGSGTSVGFQVGYYGKNFGVIGTVGSATGNLTIDGVSTSLVFNLIKSVASDDFHTVAYANTGNTVIIEATDFTRSYSDVTQLSPGITTPIAKYTGEVWVRNFTGFGTSMTGMGRFGQIEKMQGQAVTLTDSVGDGTAFFVNVAGQYAVNVVGQSDVATLTGIAIVVNGTGARLRSYVNGALDLMTDPNIGEVVDGDWTNVTVAATSQSAKASAILRLNVGDNVRFFMQEISTSNRPTLARARIVYLGP